MGGFFGGASSGSFLLDSQGPGTLQFTATENIIYQVNVSGFSAGRILRTHAHLNYSLIGPDTNNLTLRAYAGTPAGTLLGTISTDFENDFDSFDVEDDALILEFLARPEPDGAYVFTAHFQTNLAFSEQGQLSGVSFLRQAFDSNPAVDPSDETIFTLTAQLAVNDGDSGYQRVIGFTEILRTS